MMRRVRIERRVPPKTILRHPLVSAVAALAALWIGPLAAPSWPAAAKSSGPRAPSLTEALTREVDGARRVARELGVSIVDLSSRETAFAFSADQPRILASNTKLFTTAAALGTLGSEHRFRTRLMLRGSVTEGALDGDLAVFGGGDPNISGRFHEGDSYAVFRGWAAELKARGVTHIRGDLVLVNGLFLPPGIHPDWPKDQLTSWYEAPIDALSFNDNCVLVRVTPGRQVGAPARVETVPRLDYFTIQNTARTVASRKDGKLFVGRLGESDTLVVSGAIFSGSGPSEEWVAVRDPAAYFGAALRSALVEEGLTLDGSVRMEHGLAESDWELVATFESDLGRTLEVTNKRSQNFYAETLAKFLGWKRAGQGSWETGVAAVSEFLTGLGLPPSEFRLVDGSGLSRGNRASPRAMTTLLERMYFHALGRDFLRSLPFSGEPGLRWERRLARPPYAGNVFAKTGTIRGVSTLSGYAKAVSGKVYAFSILCNQVRSTSAAQAAQDRIVSALIDRG